MSNTLFPFNNNPASTEIKDNASYTVPANKFARITVLSTNSADNELSYDLSVGGASTAAFNEHEMVSTNPTTNSATFVTAYTVPAGAYFLGQVVSTHSASAGGAEFKIGSGGYAFLSNAVTGTPARPSTAELTQLKLGSGEIIQHRTNAGGTTTTHISGVLVKNRTGASEFWLKAGDQITFPGVILINEYNVPS